MPILSIAALVRIAVFVLFHPTELQVKPLPGQVLIIENARGRIVLESAANLRGPARVTGRAGAPADFILSVPGRIERRFHGVLDVRAARHELHAIIAMDLETAVASAVAAESPPGAPLEEMKAQAVVSRSFYAAARGRHAGFDYCDTTHCQFLREPPAPHDPAFQAARQTRNLMLAYQGSILPALYSANCGGHTDSLDEPTGYPYFSVACPSAGAREGHGHGLCQRGAADMAARGVDFRAILEHYYPNTEVRSQPRHRQGRME